MKKANYEKEGYYYHCLDCGEFYKIIKGKRVYQLMSEYTKTNETNFSNTERRLHKCLKQKHPYILHGVKRKTNGTKITAQGIV